MKESTLSITGIPSSPLDSGGDAAIDANGVGTPEHLRLTFARAAMAADRAVGLWLARTPTARIPDDLLDPSRDDSTGEVHALRALVRASATAYARRLRRDGVTPERMLVLVKSAVGHPGSAGFGVRELTNDLVRWSIEAFFDG